MYIAANLTSDADGQWFYSGLKIGHVRRDVAAGGRDPLDERLRAVPGSRGARDAELRPRRVVHGRPAARATRCRRSRPPVARRAPAPTCSSACNRAARATPPIRSAAGSRATRTRSRRRPGSCGSAPTRASTRGMNPGSPLLAFAPSKVELIVPDFYAGEPAIMFEITAGPLAGKWWYWSEQISRPSVQARRSRPGRRSRRTRRRAPGSRSAGGRRTAATRSDTPATRRGSRRTRAATSATCYRRSAPTPAPAPACPAARRSAAPTTQPGTQGHDPPHERLLAMAIAFVARRAGRCSSSWSPLYVRSAPTADAAETHYDRPCTLVALLVIHTIGAAVSAATQPARPSRRRRRTRPRRLDADESGNADEHGDRHGDADRLPLAPIPRRRDRHGPRLRPGRAQPGRSRARRRRRSAARRGSRGQQAPAITRRPRSGC